MSTQTREYIVEVDSIQRDVSSYPSPFQFQVHLKDNYRFVTKVELLKARLFVPLAKDTDSKYLYNFRGYTQYESAIKMSNRPNASTNKENIYNGVTKLYMTIDEFQKGNIQSSNTNINNAFCSFDVDARDSNLSYKFDSKNEFFPSTTFPLNSPLPGLNRFTVTLHPGWTKLPFPVINDESLTSTTYATYTTYKLEENASRKKVEVDSNSNSESGSYIDYVEYQKKNTYLLNIEAENFNAEQAARERKQGNMNQRSWGILNEDIKYKSIDNGVLNQRAIEDNPFFLTPKYQNRFLFKITCVTPTSTSQQSSLDNRIQFM
jgi:hypothetical protein